MSYKDWKNSRASLATFCDWYEVYKLMDVLQTIRRELELGDFWKQYLPRYYRLIVDERVPAPYSEYKRFPNSESYFCDTAGKVSELQVFYANLTTAEKVDAAVKVRKLILEMISDILQGSSVFDQTTFEQWGGISWF